MHDEARHRGIVRFQLAEANDRMPELEAALAGRWRAARPAGPGAGSRAVQPESRRGRPHRRPCRRPGAGRVRDDFVEQVYFADPDGNVIELLQQHDEPTGRKRRQQIYDRYGEP